MFSFRLAAAAVLSLLLSSIPLWAQTAITDPIHQTIRGTVLDADSRQPLPGATIVLIGSDPLIGASADADGEFRLEQVPLGRWNLGVSFIGFEPQQLPQILVSAGKETVLQIALTESISNLQTVVVHSDDERGRALNEMATVSARSFSTEETGRYAAGIFDPARMAMNFAGVAASGDDLSNEIVVRGNSPRGLLWRLEGIEIPNPNHFGSLGAGGGAISMLSSSTLAASDFYTGAFPAEFGNATAGVFDLKLREGNNEQREYSFMAGLLGIEAAAEGPFKKESDASYLINYRYSTLALLSTFLQPVGDILPTYQDLSFKINVPTKGAGTFSLWGLGGTNHAKVVPDADSTAWEGSYDAEGYDEYQTVGVVGIGHRLLLGQRTWMRTVATASTDRYRDKYYNLVPAADYTQEYYDSTNFEDNALRISWMIHHKINARQSIRSGLIYSHLSYRYDYQNADSNGVWTSYLNGNGQTGLSQAYTQWRYRFHADWVLNLGVHGTWLQLNDAWSVDPRAALSWQETQQRRWTLAAGLHTKPEHLSSYFLQSEQLEEDIPARINRDMELTKAAHLVLGLNQQIGSSWRLSAEAYGQYLYDVPVDADSGSTGSVINALSIWDIVGVDSANSNGQGYNIGLDLTIERSLQNGWYMLATGSVFRSRYRPTDGNWYPTSYDRGFTANVVAGKEWPVGQKENKTIGFNGKVNTQGGRRTSTIDLAASREAGKTVLVPGAIYADRLPAYYRFDLGFQYRIERSKTTHALMLDIQNVSNRQNIAYQYFDSETGNIESGFQTGIFPFLNYRISF